MVSEVNEQLSDDLLIARIALRDAGALATLYDRYAPAVLAVAMLVVGDAQAAESTVVDTFWALWQAKGLLPVDGASVRNRLMLFARRQAGMSLGEAQRGHG
jgi:RNA polymerase sigma-70 factor (ECF subfamily)